MSEKSRKVISLVLLGLGPLPEGYRAATEAAYLFYQGLGYRYEGSVEEVEIALGREWVPFSSTKAIFTIRLVHPSLGTYEVVVAHHQRSHDWLQVTVGRGEEEGSRKFGEESQIPLLSDRSYPEQLVAGLFAAVRLAAAYQYRKIGWTGEDLEALANFAGEQSGYSTDPTPRAADLLRT